MVARLLVSLAVWCTLASNAAAATCSDAAIEWVNKSYVAYYGRPADPGGLDYWACRMDAEGDLASIIGAFGVSEEFNSRYGLLDNEQLLDTVYLQMFNRVPDPEGKGHYLPKLQSGAMTLQTITLYVLGGATGSDSAIISNKLDVASYFTDQLRANQKSYDGIDEVQAILSSVDDTLDSRDVALSSCDSLISSWPEQTGTPDSITVPTSDANGSYQVSWAASTTIDVSYILEEATNAAFTTELQTIYTGPAVLVGIAGRLSGKTYYYRVMATKVGASPSAWQSGANGCVVTSIFDPPPTPQ